MYLVIEFKKISTYISLLVPLFARTCQSCVSRAMVLSDHSKKCVEQKLGVERAAAPFRMKLRREYGLGVMDEALVRVVIAIDEQGLDSLRKRRLIDGIAMVLGSDVGSAIQPIQTRLIVTSVSERELIGPGSQRFADQLVAHTDAEQALGPILDVVLYVLDELSGQRWIAGPIRNKQAVVDLVGEVIVVRDHFHFAATLHQVSDDAFFDATIDGQDFQWISFAVHFDLLSGDVPG